MASHSTSITKTNQLTSMNPLQERIAALSPEERKLIAEFLDAFMSETAPDKTHAHVSVNFEKQNLILSGNTWQFNKCIVD